jgi:hypothetical protein
MGGSNIMRITRNKMRKMIIESLLQEASRQDAQGVGMLVREITRAVVEKIKKVESLNSDIEYAHAKLIYYDDGLEYHKKVENDIENAFSELKNEGTEILERARSQTKNKNSIIFKISDFRFDISFLPQQPHLGLPLSFKSPGAGYDIIHNVVVVKLKVRKNFNYPTQNYPGGNFDSVNELIQRWQETLYHELHHTKQIHSLNPGGLNYNVPDDVSIDTVYKAKKEAESVTGLQKYIKLVQYAYTAIKRKILMAELEGSPQSAKDYNYYLKNETDDLNVTTSDFINNLIALSPDDKFYHLTKEFLSYTPFGGSTYSSFKGKVFLVYYFFNQTEIEAYPVGFMRSARLKLNKTSKRQYKTMTKDEIKFDRKHKLGLYFYEECLKYIKWLNKAGSEQIETMFESADTSHKNSISLEALLNKHHKLCYQLLGLWFDYAISRYGVLNDLFELEKTEIQKWKLSGGTKGLNPRNSVEKMMKSFMTI